MGEQLAHPPLAVVAPGLQHHAEPGPPPLVAATRIHPQYGDVTGRGIRKPSRISIVVVLPAPFGPSNASTSPRCAVNVTPSRTSVVP